MDARAEQMQFVHCPVHTIVVGQASSMASLILAGGASASTQRPRV